MAILLIILRNTKVYCCALFTIQIVGKYCALANNCVICLSNILRSYITTEMCSRRFSCCYIITIQSLHSIECFRRYFAWLSFHFIYKNNKKNTTYLSHVCFPLHWHCHGHLSNTINNVKNGYLDACADSAALKHLRYIHTEIL